MIILWALLISKCFTLEYLITVYEVPINSAIYVWTLSLFMASVASAIYLKIQQDENGQLHAFSKITIIWWACMTLILILFGAGFIWESINQMHSLAVAATITGCGYLSQFMLQKDRMALICAAGWWGGAALPFYLSAPLPLLTFAFCALAFTALPCFILYLQERREIDQAIKALHTA